MQELGPFEFLVKAPLSFVENTSKIPQTNQNKN